MKDNSLQISIFTITHSTEEILTNIFCKLHISKLSQQFISRCILRKLNSIIEIRPKKKLKVAFNDSKKQNVYTIFSITFLPILIVDLECHFKTSNFKITEKSNIPEERSC
jgi:hypothetical protein